jgi:hypothetical protein
MKNYKPESPEVSEFSVEVPVVFESSLCEVKLNPPEPLLLLSADFESSTPGLGSETPGTLLAVSVVTGSNLLGLKPKQLLLVPAVPEPWHPRLEAKENVFLLSVSELNPNTEDSKRRPNNLVPAVSLNTPVPVVPVLKPPKQELILASAPNPGLLGPNPNPVLVTGASLPKELFWCRS